MTQTRFNWDPRAAKQAGALYLAIAVCGGFSIGYVPMQITGSDVAQTSANLLAQGTLFRFGVLADSAVILLELAITVILYRLFRHAGPALALTALIARLGMIVVMGINLLLWVMPFALLQGPDPSAAVIAFCLEAHDMGVFVWQLFFGAHLIALGWLALRTDIVPRLLGFGLIIGAFGYLVQGLVKLTFVSVAALDVLIIGLLVIVTLSEVGFALWLLMRGSRKGHARLTPQPLAA